MGKKDWKHTHQLLTAEKAASVEADSQRETVDNMETEDEGVVKEGDLVVLFGGRDHTNSIVVEKGKFFQHKFGVYKHEQFIGTLLSMSLESFLLSILLAPALLLTSCTASIPNLHCYGLRCEQGGNMERVFMPNIAAMDGCISYGQHHNYCDWVL